MANTSATTTPSAAGAATGAPSPNATDSAGAASATPGNIVTRKTSPAEVLLIYGFTLMLCGALAFHASGYKDKAISSVYMGNGAALVSFVLAVGCRNIHLKKGDSGFRMLMICIHLALVFPLVMAGVVSWRMALAWAVPSKAYILPYLGGIVLSSLITFALLFSFKPAKKSPGAVAEQDAAAGQKSKRSLSPANDDTTSSMTTDATDPDSTPNGSTDPTAFGRSTENGSLTGDTTMPAGAANTSSRDTGSMGATQTYRHGSKSSSGDKPHKQHVVRRRPRRAQAL